MYIDIQCFDRCGLNEKNLFKMLNHTRLSIDDFDDMSVEDTREFIRVYNLKVARERKINNILKDDKN